MTTQRREVRSIFQSILDKYGVLCTIQHEAPLCDALADAAIEKLKPKRKPRTPAQTKSAELYHLARAIADVCLMDYDANNGRLLREAKLLTKATPPPTPADVKRHYSAGGTWYVENWHGRNGREPRPSQIRETWAKLVGGATPEGDGPKEFTV